MSKRLALVECPTHGFKAVSIEDEGGGIRVTPGKCCGRWVTTKEWAMSEREWRSLAGEALAAADEGDPS